MRISQRTARGYVESARVARLATADVTARPHLVPITFAVLGEEIVTAIDHKPKSTRALRRLRNIAGNPRVAVLVDHYDDDWSRLWWVRADGEAAVVEVDDRADLLAALRAKYPQYRERPPEGPLIVIAVRRWSGWAASSDANRTS